MLDLHTHLYWKSYAEDREAVIARAREAGVRQMLVVGTTVRESQQALELARQYPEMYATVGMHPHEFNEGGSAADDLLFQFVSALRSLAQDRKVIGIGECGLDYFSHDPRGEITAEERSRQKEGFKTQLRLAADLGLPVIVHCRNAYEDLLGLLRAYPRLKYVLHCYMGDTEVTAGFLELPDVWFSFTGNITYPVRKEAAGTKDDLGETVRLIPLSRLFVETDCPFLAPQSKRGERNEPAFVLETGKRVCELLEITQSELEGALQENFARVFED